jgi:hypothetical protein
MVSSKNHKVSDVMRISQILKVIQGKLYSLNVELSKDYLTVFSCDLMSDCLAMVNENCILITGLTNIQSLRTAEMLDIDFIIFVRGKNPTPEMIEIARVSHIVLVSTQFSMFETSGILYSNGMKPIVMDRCGRDV